MLKTNESIMLAEAKKARFKPNFFIQILIFIAVMIAVEIVIGILIGLPTAVWMISQPEFMNAIMNGDTAALMSFSLNTPDWVMIIQLFATVIETLAAIIYCRFIEKRSLNSMGFICRGWFKNYLAGYAIGAVMILASCAIAVISGTMTLTFSASVSVLYIVLFFAGYLVQGMAEETIVRGYFMVSLTNSLHNRYAAAIAVGISSAAFSLLHLFNPGMTLLSVINLILSGIFFAVYILRFDNIWGACAAHSAWNFFQGNIIGSKVSGLTMSSSILNASVSDSGTLINGGSFGLEGGLAVTIVEVTAILLIIFIPRIKKQTADI